MRCPVCGSSVSLDQPVCGNCGATLPKIGPPSTIGGLFEDVLSAATGNLRYTFLALGLLLALAEWWKIVLPVVFIAAVVAFLLGRSRGPDSLNLRG